MNERSLDLDAVHAFVRVAEFSSFTRAAEALGTTQSSVSLKLTRLEHRLGHRLIERSPRRVHLSSQGAIFLDRAHELLAAHDRACAAFPAARRRLSIGISDHVAGPELPVFIARMCEKDPSLLIEIRIASSGDLLKDFDHRLLDAVMVRLHAGRSDGDVLAEERFGWYAAPGWQPRPDEPLPLATMPEPCGVRLTAGQALDEAGIEWREIFVGGGVAAVSAAVLAGLGVSALARRMLPLGAVEVSTRLGLPKLPCLPIVLHSHVRDEPSRDAIATLSAAFRSVVPR